MSFSKAKITRFNEKLPWTPSPAEYNVKIKNNTPGAALSKTERFGETKSPQISDNGSIMSANSTPCFRTPTLPKKKKSIFTLSSRKPKQTELFDKNADLEALKDKIVECNNKDSYIKDLTEQIEEMKLNLCTLERQKTDLLQERNKFEENAHELKEEHRIVLQNIYLEHDKEVNDLKLKFNKAEIDLLEAEEEFRMLEAKRTTTITTLTDELEHCKELQKSGLKKLEDTINEKESVIKEITNAKESLQMKIEDLQKTHSQEIDSIKKSHKDQITELEFEMLKSISELQNQLDKEQINCNRRLQEAQKEFEAEKTKIFEESNAKVKQVEENSIEANVLAEMQMQERCKDIELTWQQKLDEQEKQSELILKECQDISEYNIIQCEFEKKQITLDLTKKTEELNQIQKENADLSIACRELEMKYNDLNQSKTSTIELEKCQQELTNALNQKKVYEISINKIHITIEALKTRLLNSDRDVEQLKSELELCEISKLEYQGKCNQLSEELEIVGRLNEDLELQYENTIRNTEERISKLETDLLAKVEEYKSRAQSEIDEVKMKLLEKEESLVMALQQLHDQHTLNTQAQILIATAQERMEELAAKDVENNRYKESYLRAQLHLEETDVRRNELQMRHDELQLKLEQGFEESSMLKTTLEIYKLKMQESDTLLKQITQLQEKCESYSQYCDYYKAKTAEHDREMEELSGINKKYIEQSGRYDELLQKFEALEVQNAALEKKVAEQESLIGPFREQLEAYEVEHNCLLSMKSEAESEARYMGLKYAELLGHQNQKQKIKHMMNLKAKNHELAENKKDLELKLKGQTRMIEKLKKELASVTKSPHKSRLPSTDKENLNSPNRTLNSSRVESPGPLRERN